MTEFDQRNYARCPGEPHRYPCRYCGHPGALDEQACDSCDAVANHYSGEHCAWFCDPCALREGAIRCMNGIHDTRRCPTCGERLDGEAS